MFSLFSPKHPLSTFEKTWTESRMAWCAEQFGLERLRRAAVVLPTEEFFPGAFDGSEEMARELFHRIAGYLQVDVTRMGFAVLDDVQRQAAGHSDAAGSTPVIRLARSQLAEPPRLLATLTHALIHELLLGQRWRGRDVPDMEQATDLLAVFFGLGAIVANATVSESSGHTGHAAHEGMHAHGCLPSRMLAYGMALFAWVRGAEDRPDGRYLRRDAADIFRQALRYLERTGDSLFGPDGQSWHGRTHTTAALIEHLRDGTPTYRMAAMWKLGAAPDQAVEAIDALAHCLRDRDADLREHAALTLGRCGARAVAAVPPLVAALQDRRPGVRLAAAVALGAIQQTPGEVLPELGALLEDPERDVVVEAAAALGRFGRAAGEWVPGVLRAFKRALVDCRDQHADRLADALRRMVPDPQAAVAEFFAGFQDDELFEYALSRVSATERESEQPAEAHGERQESRCPPAGQGCPSCGS
jgi:hypothetical protein